MNEQMIIDFINRIADNDKVSPFQNGFVVLTNKEMVKFVDFVWQDAYQQGYATGCSDSVVD